MSILTTADPKKKLEQPPWVQPSGGVDVGLRVYNSLTSKLEPFIPQEGRLVKWYICGPTVYDSAHLGHAMTYITFDIIRRILEDYFNYEVFFVMNITDVDDKIIVRARRNYLMKQFTEKRKSQTGWDEEILNDIKKALEYYIKDKDKKLGVLQEDIKHSTGKVNKKELEADLSIAATKQYSAKEKLNAISSKSIEELNKTIPDPIQFAYDPLVEYLDALHGPSLSNDTMREAIREHASKFETDFFTEMNVLNVKSPDVLTRVSDYIDEVVQMVSKIVDNGYAYESNGSVYFNTGKFDPSLVNANPPDNHHFYGKLEPWSIGNRKLHQDGEGVLMKDVPEHDKRSPIDFALWKKSKPGEPGWNTVFGYGRPGWHIECSAMASTILGKNIDIHSGGEDLRFPHHDNELAQSEACFGTHQWVNYFLHTGHLNIEGLKMSKSLKNFITIKEILGEFSPFQIRMLFLTQYWNKSFNFRKDSLDKAKNYEKYFLEFLSKVNTLATDKSEQSKSQKWTDADVELSDLLRTTQRLVHERLLDNFDTPGVITALLDLINKSNFYLTNPDRKVLLLTSISAYVEKMLNIFGLITEEDQAEQTRNISRPIVQQFCDLRNEVRTAVKNVLESDQGFQEKKSPEEILSITKKYDEKAFEPFVIESIPLSQLNDYATIPMIVHIDHVLDTSLSLGNPTLTTLPISQPYYKNYDEHCRPTDWPSQFDLSNWRIYLVRNTEGTPIAGAAVTYNTNNCNELEGDARTATLWDLRVHPDYRRRGIAGALLARAVEYARECNCKRILIETQHVNVTANLFYQSLGCVLISIDPHAYQSTPSLAHEVKLTWEYNLESKK